MKTIKNKYLNNIRLQYFITFFHAMVPAYVIERLFWQEKGLNIQQVVYCEAIYSVTIVIMEIPSGILADKLGRKPLLLLYGILASFEFILLPLSSGFPGFAVTVFFCGIGYALLSGSMNALLYDSMLQEGIQKDFEKVCGRIQAIDFTGSTIAALSGSVMANYLNYAFNYYVSFVFYVVSFILLCFLKEPPHQAVQRGEELQIWEYVTKGIHFFRDHRLVLLYCSTGAFLGACLVYLDEFWQLVMQEIQMPVLLFGVISSGMMIARVPGNLLAYRVKQKFSYRCIFSVVLSVNIIGYAAVFFTRSRWCLVPMFGVMLASGVTDPLVEGYLHHRVGSDIRATVESFLSQGLRFLSILIGLLFSFVSDRYSLFTGFLILGILCIGYIQLFWFFSRGRRSL